MNKIATIARSSSNAIRSHGVPVLEAGNLSFPNGRYTVDFEPGEDRTSFVLKHRVEGAPLISRLLREERARYVCAVSSPISSYRRTHASTAPSQHVRWDTDDLGEPPLFTPMIVSIESSNLRLDREHDGVHEVWHHQRVLLLKGSRLALGPVVQLRSSILQLLSLISDPALPEGTFLVDAETEPFQFLVKLNPGLHASLKYHRKDGIREHIMTHIVSACLALLQRDFNEDDDENGGWKSHRNLGALADFLEDRKLPHWTDENFRPEQIATSLYPHTLPHEQSGEYE